MSRKPNPIDDALDDSFPASDPSAHSGTTTASPSQSVIADASDQAEFSVWRVVGQEDREQPFRAPTVTPARRWTSAGVDVVYAADSPATALLEWLAHLEEDPPTRICLAEGRVRSSFKHAQTALPSTWQDAPYRSEVQAIGDAWVASGESLALQVPSALCPASFNFLINPGHGDAASIRACGVQVFSLDPRLSATGRSRRGPR